jgi:toxin ParE1/3/4
LNGLRFWRLPGFGNHLIFYLTNEQCIEIVRVLHGARNIDAILRNE